jgi:CubicO group peptidase (beta-lactamase class C family)
MFATVAMIVASLALAPLPDKAAIDEYVVKTWPMIGSPGLSVAVVENGKVVFAKGYGMADLQNSLPVKPKTVFRLGSITKQFTATMILQLAGEGKLSLDDKVGKLLPDSPQSWADITVRHLLTHTSGIHNYTSLPDFLEAVKKPIAPEHINDEVKPMPLDFAPGAKWSYSNSGYEELGLIVEKLDHRTYEKSLHARILDPLGMRETYFVPNAAIVQNRACGYTRAENRFANCAYLDMGWPYAAGSMESTVMDLAKWDAALYTAKVLPKNVLEQMWTKAKLNDGTTSGYGFGWEIGEVNGLKNVSHGGGIFGFATDISRFPTLGLTIIALTNSDTAEVGRFVRDLQGFLDKRLEAKPVATIHDGDPATTALIRRAVESALKGSPDPTLFSEKMMKEVFTPTMVKGLATQSAAMGPLESMTLTKSSDEGGTKKRTYRMKFKNVELTGEFEVSKDGVVQSAGLH